jgi:hypothetical protein
MQIAVIGILYGIILYFFCQKEETSQIHDITESENPRSKRVWQQ